jgi:hypothetical protein
VGVTSAVKVESEGVLLADGVLEMVGVIEVVDEDILIDGGGGGGIALRSRDAFTSSPSCSSSSLDPASVCSGAAMLSLL